MLSLARPDITQAEIDAVVGVLRTPTLSLGPKLRAFESAFAKTCGTQHAVACSSGTAALHLLVEALGIGAGDEVITTPFSFIASANCILMAGATPVFVDIDSETWNLDAALIEAAITPRSKAVIPVDVFGNIADMEPIRDVAQRHKLTVIEDSCEALGSRLRGRPAGSLGDAGVFGFYPNKQITTGEGGMIVTDREPLAALASSMRNQGRDGQDGWLVHRRLGYNYRLSELACALGLAQLARLDEIVAHRRRVLSWYESRLAVEPGVLLQRIREGVELSPFVFVVRLSDEYDRADRDRILGGLRDRGIGCSNYFSPIHLQPFYGERFGFAAGDFPRCEALADRTIALPFHHALGEADVDRVCRELLGLIQRPPRRQGVTA
ncbi:MAG: DegT/DnrJ/EryC1/StrS family aminotransferase [Phycisphaerae bacterium]